MVYYKIIDIYGFKGKDDITMQKPELLAPAGSFEKAKIAFLYGADEIYCGTSTLTLISPNWSIVGINWLLS